MLTKGILRAILCSQREHNQNTQSTEQPRGGEGSGGKMQEVRAYTAADKRSAFIALREIEGTGYRCCRPRRVNPDDGQPYGDAL